MHFFKLCILDFISLVYPALCLNCEILLEKNSDLICLKCKARLPKTQSHNREIPYIKERFYGRINPSSIYAFLHYKRKGIVQKLFYEFKYKANKDIAIHLGELFGEEIKNESLLKRKNSVLIPIPLHPSKEKVRGYNQSEEISKGLSNKLNIPIDTTSLIREKKGDSQTRKSRLARWESLQKTFVVSGNDLTGKHVLLVDDVLTTGATLEICYRELLKLNPASINILVLAVTPPN